MDGTAPRHAEIPEVDGATALSPSRRWRLPLRFSFVASASSLVLVFAAAGTPIPLFNTYRVQDGLTNANFGLLAVGLLVAAATALLVLGRLSNHLGRRPVALAAIASAVASCLILITLRGMAPLLVARALQGFSCGLASSSLGSYVVDSAPKRPRWLAALITGSAPMIGIPIGALVGGALVQYGPDPRRLVYEIMALVLAACALAMIFSPETMRRSRGALASLRPRLQWPQGTGVLLFAVGASLVATWSLQAFYQAFAPSLAVEYLGSKSPLVAATMFAAVMVLNPLGGALSGRLAPSRSLRAGMIVYIIAVVAIILALRAGAGVAFIGGSLAAGIAQGVSSTGGIRGLLSSAAPHERAGLLATIYLVSYSGAAIPGIVAGRLATTLSLFQIAVG
jgi:MFS family permease